MLMDELPILRANLVTIYAQRFIIYTLTLLKFLTIIQVVKPLILAYLLFDRNFSGVKV